MTAGDNRSDTSRSESDSAAAGTLPPALSSSSSTSSSSSSAASSSSSSSSSSRDTAIVLPPVPESTRDNSSSSPSSMIIPRMFHLIWPNKDFAFDGDHKVEEEETHRYVSKLRELHPGWALWVWTDAECEELVRRHRPDFMSIWQALTPRLKMWDAIRPLILQVYGGVYIDADVDCRRPFTPLLPSGVRVLLRANWHKTLGYVKEFESESAVVSGNHIMGSVPRHPVWESYLRRVGEVQAEDPQRAVTAHTGNIQLQASVLDFLETHPEERASFRLMSLGEFENSGECARMNKLKFSAFQRAFLGKDACANLVCTHVHALSPAEAAGGDDNAAGQIRKSSAANSAANSEQQRKGAWEAVDHRRSSRVVAAMWDVEQRDAAAAGGGLLLVTALAVALVLFRSSLVRACSSRCSSSLRAEQQQQQQQQRSSSSIRRGYRVRGGPGRITRVAQQSHV